MDILYTDVPPLRTNNTSKNFRSTFEEYIQKADSVEIASGYASQDSIELLDNLIKESHIKHISLILGMYYIEGIPENILNSLQMLDSKWRAQGIGEVYIVKTFRYHGKSYLFSKDNKPFAGIIGSANLGAIALNAQTRRQYELSVNITDQDTLSDLHEHIKRLKAACSMPLSKSLDIPIIRQENQKLRNIEHVQRINSDEVNTYKDHLTDNTIEIPLKVPLDHNDPHLRGSNINVCYAKGRPRKWWETEIIASKNVYSQSGYPKWREPFMVVTDDGWKFLAWTSGDHNKNLYTKDDLKILGYWLKGRLVAAGIVKPIDHVEDDTEFKGLITKKMLEQYGRTTITLSKTDQKTKDEKGNTVDVWLLSFLPEDTKED